MRSLIVIVVTAVVSLALGTGAATASPAQPFRAPESCQRISASFTVCFEAWGVSQVTSSASGHTTVVGHVHRRFTEFTNGVLTFEQRDMIHRVRQISDGQTDVETFMFSGWSTPVGLTCRWREHLLVRDGEVLHDVDAFSCEAAA